MERKMGDGYEKGVAGYCTSPLFFSIPVYPRISIFRFPALQAQETLLTPFYSHDSDCLDESQNRTRKILQGIAEDVFFKNLDTNIATLQTF